jgi:hypothetical protein
MKECRWLKPVLVGQFEFVEWTADSSPPPHALHCNARRQDGSRRAVGNCVAELSVRASFTKSFDVTERKIANQERLKLAGRLIKCSRGGTKSAQFGLPKMKLA